MHSIKSYSYHKNILLVIKMNNFIRVGIVSVTYPEKNSCRVMFPDNDNLVSGELRILHRGSAKNQDYWMPDVDDEVVCIFPGNDDNYSDGFVVGSLFNEVQKPNASSQDIQRKDFSGGSYFEFDRSSGNLEISCTGNITLKAKNIYLN